MTGRWEIIYPPHIISLTYICRKTCKLLGLPFCSYFTLLDFFLYWLCLSLFWNLMKHCFKFTLHLSNILALLHPTYRLTYAWGKRPFSAEKWRRLTQHCMIMNKAELTFLKVRKENEHFLQKIQEVSEATSWWVLPWMVMEVIEIWLLTQSCYAHAAFVKSPLMMNACLSNSCKDVDSPGAWQCYLQHSVLLSLFCIPSPTFGTRSFLFLTLGLFLTRCH